MTLTGQELFQTCIGMHWVIMLDYGNAILMCMPLSWINQLQSIISAGVWLVATIQKLRHISNYSRDTPVMPGFLQDPYVVLTLS